MTQKKIAAERRGYIVMFLDDAWWVILLGLLPAFLRVPCSGHDLLYMGKWQDGVEWSPFSPVAKGGCRQKENDHTDENCNYALAHHKSR